MDDERVRNVDLSTDGGTILVDVSADGRHVLFASTSTNLAATSVGGCGSGGTQACQQLLCGEIDWLVDSGVAAGYGDGTFRPTVPITRQAMAALIWRYDVLTGIVAG